MINLAGRKDSDQLIRSELTEAGIEIKNCDEYGEPKATLYGEISTIYGEYKFHRAWYYWVVSGLVPLHIAQVMYLDPLGRKDVRVAGYAGNDLPENWVRKYNCYYDDGRIFSKDLWPPEEFEKFKKLQAESKAFADMEPPEVYDPVKLYPQFINSYHIDSQEGLNMFVLHTQSTNYMWKLFRDYRDAQDSREFMLNEFYLERAK